MRLEDAVDEAMSRVLSTTADIEDDTCMGECKTLARGIVSLRNQLTASRAECEEQARLNGMGSEREAKLRAEVEAAQKRILMLEKGEQTMYECSICHGNEVCACGSCAKCPVPHDGRVHALLERVEKAEARVKELNDASRIINKNLRDCRNERVNLMDDNDLLKSMIDKHCSERDALAKSCGEMRAKAFNEMAEYCRNERREICGGRPECIVGDTYKTGRHDGMGALMAFCERKAAVPAQPEGE